MSLIRDTAHNSIKFIPDTLLGTFEATVHVFRMTSNAFARVVNFTYYVLEISGTRVCCVFFPFILDIKFVGRTSRGHTGGSSHIIFHPPSFCGACLFFSREKDSASPFPRRP